MHLWGGRPVVMVGPVGCGKTTLAKWAIAQQVGGGRARVVTTEDLLAIHHDTAGGNLSESLRVMNRSVRTRTVVFLDDLVAVMSRDAVRAVTGEFATIRSPALAVLVTVDSDTYWGSTGAPLREWKDAVQVRMFEPGFRDVAGTFGPAAARFAGGDLRQAATFRSGAMGSGVLGGADRELALMDAYRHLERTDECGDALRDLVFDHYPRDVYGSDAVASMAAVAGALSDTDTMGYGRPARCALGLHLRAAPLIGQPPKKRVRRPRAGGRADTVRAADVALSGPMHAGRNTIESMDRLWLYRAKALAGDGLCPGLPKGAAAFMTDLGGLACVQQHS
jgi:hypothetical protein